MAHGRTTHGDKILGFRAEPRAFHWAVVSGTLVEPVLEGCATESSPRTYGEPETLAWARQTAIHILDRFSPATVAVRYAERNSRSSTTDAGKSRCRLEGVLIEASSAKNKPVITGAFNTFGKQSGNSSLKDELDSEDLRGLDWSQHGDNLREAIIVAYALLPE